MNKVISTGNSELDAALCVGGLPRAAVTEIRGLNLSDLTCFLTRILEDVQECDARLFVVRDTQPDAESWYAIEKLIRQGTEFVALLAADAHSDDWLSDANTANRLKALATEYEATVVVAIPMTVRLNSELRPAIKGLAGAAAIRLQLSRASAGSQIHVRITKNHWAEPSGEAYYR